MKRPNEYIKNYLGSIAALEAIETDQQHISTAIRQQSFSQQHDLIRAVITGVARHYETLRHWVQQQTKFKPKDQNLRRLIMIGAFQYQFMQNGRSRETIFQAAETATHLNRGWAKHIVYAVLNKLRNNDMPMKVNAPAWLVDKLQQDHPKEMVDQILACWQAPPSNLCLRIAPGQTSLTQVQNTLQEQGIDTHTCALSTIGLHAKQQDLDKILKVSDQNIYIQDCIHQHSPSLIPTLPKHARVLDACAAPGGKTTALLCIQPNRQVDALEISPSRAERLKDNLSHHDQANVIIGDALNTAQWWDGKPYDAIIVDAPCSATGLIQKKPEIKLIQTPKNIDILKKKQRDILDSLWPLLRKGGALLYSTCSVLAEENERVVHPFIEAVEGEFIPTETAPKGYKTHLPDKHHTGGFIALIRKFQTESTELSTG